MLKSSLTKWRSAVLWRRGAPLTSWGLRSLSLSDHLLILGPGDDCSPWCHDMTHGEIKSEYYIRLIGDFKKLDPTPVAIRFPIDFPFALAGGHDTIYSLYPHNIHKIHNIRNINKKILSYCWGFCFI